MLHHQGRTVGWFRCRLGAAKPQIFTIWPFTAKARPPTPGPSEFKLQTHSLTCVPFQISINHANGGRYRDFGLSGLYRVSGPLAIPAASQVYLVINLYILSLILVGLASLLFPFLNCFIKCNWNAYLYGRSCLVTEGTFRPHNASNTTWYLVQIILGSNTSY